MESEPPFKVVIAYENLPAAIRAREISSRLEAELRWDRGIDCDFWKFDLLGHPTLLRQAVAEAAQASMIIVSAQSSHLPADLKMWVKNWPAQGGENLAALVVLLDEEQNHSGDGGPLTAFLRQVAQERRMDFFCKTGVCWARELEPLNDLFRRQQKNESAQWQGAASRDYIWSGWGIND